MWREFETVCGVAGGESRPDGGSRGLMVRRWRVWWLSRPGMAVARPASVRRCAVEYGGPATGRSSLRTVQRWPACYRADGDMRLTRSRRADCGRRQIPTQLVEAIEGLALWCPRPDTAPIHRQVVELAVSVYVCRGDVGGWTRNAGCRRGEWWSKGRSPVVADRRQDETSEAHRPFMYCEPWPNSASSAAGEK